MEKHIIRWFQLAGDRDGGRKDRENTQKQKRGTANASAAGTDIGAADN